MRAVPPFSTSHLTVVAWPDPVIDQLGHDAASTYVEKYWLGVLGPSTTWLLRHLVASLEHQPSGFQLDLEECAARLGVGMRGGRQSPFIRAIVRLVQFDMAQFHGTDTLAVRCRVPDLSRRHLMRLPGALQDEHRDHQLHRLVPTH